MRVSQKRYTKNNVSHNVFHIFASAKALSEDFLLKNLLGKIQAVDYEVTS